MDNPLDSLTKEQITEIIKKIKTFILIYAFYDTESQTYDTPFFCKSDIFAKRHYTQVIETPETMANRFSDKMEVHKLGTFCPQTGKIAFKKSILIQKPSTTSTNNTRNSLK